MYKLDTIEQVEHFHLQQSLEKINELKATMNKDNVEEDDNVGEEGSDQNENSVEDQTENLENEDETDNLKKYLSKGTLQKITHSRKQDSDVILQLVARTLKASGQILTLSDGEYVTENVQLTDESNPLYNAPLYNIFKMWNSKVTEGGTIIPGQVKLGPWQLKELLLGEGVCSIRRTTAHTEDSFDRMSCFDASILEDDPALVRVVKTTAPMPKKQRKATEVLQRHPAALPPPQFPVAVSQPGHLFSMPVLPLLRPALPLLEPATQPTNAKPDVLPRNRLSENI